MARLADPADTAAFSSAHDCSSNTNGHSTIVSRGRSPSDAHPSAAALSQSRVGTATWARTRGSCNRQNACYIRPSMTTTGSGNNRITTRAYVAMCACTRRRVEPVITFRILRIGRARCVGIARREERMPLFRKCSGRLSRRRQPDPGSLRLMTRIAQLFQ